MSRQPSTLAALADSAVLAARRAALAEPRMAALAAFARGVRGQHGPTPDFDPADGGPAAQLLLLLETPGPAIWRTGFVSMDNATGTSANLRRFLASAGIDRARLAIWNTVPWVIHTGGPNRAPKTAEIRGGLAALPGLLPVLPDLRCVVLAGRVAAMASATLQSARPDLALIQIPHPSPTYVCTSPEIPRRIVAGLTQAAELVSPRLRSPHEDSRMADAALAAGPVPAPVRGSG